jgi:short-chain fatty acids transporter
LAGGRLTGFFSRLVRDTLPDPFVYAAVLTLVALGGALLAGPSSQAAAVATTWPEALLAAWVGGLAKILEFAMQMALVLVSGHALAESPAIHRGLVAIARSARTPPRALAITVAVSLVACWLNWGFGLVVAALLARQMAAEVEGLDFALTVGAAYSGFVVWASGLSSSIALTTATHGSAVNFVEKVTGAPAPLTQTLFQPFNVVPVVLLLVVLPWMFSRTQPGVATSVDRASLEETRPSVEAGPDRPGLAGTLERLPFHRAISAVGLVFLASRLYRGTLSPDLNTVILAFLVLGMALHPTTLGYLHAWNGAARSVGPLLLQYPLYGGIMGLISSSSLVERLTRATEAVSSRHTFALLVFLASNVISLFVPSGGGHWAVQGPIVLPAAIRLGVAPGAAAMAVAMGEQTANMVQPFWALPILAIAKLGVRDVMGYCVTTFLVSLCIYGAALVIFT